MPQFTYKAKDRKGAVISGALEADSKAAASSRLQAMGYFPIDIQGGAVKSGKHGKGRRRRALKVKLSELSGFYRQMSDLIGAGIPLVKALTIVKNQGGSPALTEILSQVNSDVQGGDTFALALSKHPATFNKLAIALVKAGEAGGLLDQTLTRVAEVAERQNELRSKIKAAMAYPVLMAIFGFVVVVVLLTVVMDKVLVMFNDMDQQLPGPTVFLMNISDILRNYWLIYIPLLIVAGFVLKRLIATDKGKFQYHLLLLKLPQFGDLLLKREIAAFTRTLGSLLQNGVPILNALSISSEVLTIQPIRSEIDKMPEGITQGSGIAPTLKSSKIFPAAVVNMILIGEETGQLPEILTRVAESYEAQVDRTLKMLTSLIEPVIILIMGLVVGFIVISMLLPIFSMDPGQGM